MESTMGNEGVNKLAAVVQSQMHRIADKPEILDFGVIQGDMSLLTNRFPLPIPQTDYMVCRQLTLGPSQSILAKTQDAGMPYSGSHIHRTINLTCTHHGGTQAGTVGEDSSDGMHQHHVLLPEKMRQIKPGDRVLVCWVGDDACVIDIVLPATEVV